MGVFKLPAISSSQLSTLVLSQKEMVYCVDNNIIYYGNGTTSGGIPIMTGSAAAGAINISAGSTSNNLTNFAFSNSNGVTFGLNGSTITASVVTTYMGSNQSSNFVNTSQSSLFQQTSAMTNYLTNAKFSAGTLSTNRSDITFANSNNVSFGLNTNGVMTASIAAGAQTGISGLSAGTAQMTSGTAVFSNSNGVSFGVNGNTITASHNGLTTAMASNAGSNFVNTSAGLNLTNVSATLASNSISISVGNYLTSQSNQAVSAANGSFTFQTLSLANSNGVSFSTGTQGIFATVKTDYLTTARASNDAIGLNTAQSNVTWTVNSSGLSLDARGYAGTQTAATNASVTLNSNGLSISVEAGAAASVNFSAGTTSGNLNSVVFSNSNGVSFGLNGSTLTASHNGLTSQSNQAVSAANGSFTFQTLTFANSNGVSWSTGTQGIFATVATNYLTTARASNDAVGLNTAQTNVTWTVNSNGLSLNAAGYAGTGTTFAGTNVSASATLDSNGLNLALSAPTPGGGGAINVSAGTTSGNLQTIVFSNSNLLSFGLSGSTITASFGDPDNWKLFGNTSGTTASTIGTDGLYFQGGNNVTLSGSSNTIVVSAAGINPIYAYANQLYMLNSQTMQPRQSTSAVFPILIQDDVSFDHVRFPLTVSMGSTTLGTTANTTFSAGITYTFNVGFYRSTTNNATSLNSFVTTSAGLSQSINVQANANGSQYSVSLGLTWPQNGTGTNATNTFSSSYAVSTSNFAISTTGLTAFSGMKHFEINMQSSMPANFYWVNMGVSSSVSTQGIAGLSSPLVIHSHIAMSQINNTFGMFGQANNASIQAISGVGSFTTAGGGTVAGFGFSNISSSASHNVPYIYMEYDG